MALSFENVPTVELHRHWEAGMSPETVAMLAERNGVTSLVNGKGVALALDPQDTDSLSAYFCSIADGFERGEKPMGPFLDAFRALKGVLRTVEDIRDAIFEQLRNEQADGSLHTELRYSPMSIVEATRLRPEDVVNAVQVGIEKAWKELTMSGTQILCFSRDKGLRGGDDAFTNQAPVVGELAIDLHRRGVPVGIDIASGLGEIAYPPSMFRDILLPARDVGVPLTVHAGEQGVAPDFVDAPPEMVRQAVMELGARRIGHGTSLVADPDLRRALLEKGVGLETCPVSNAVMGYMPLDNHPMKEFLDAGLLVSAGTDDPIFFGIRGVRDMLVRNHVPLRIGVSDVLQMTRNAIDMAFVSDKRRKWMYDEYDRLIGSNSPSLEGVLMQ